MGGGNIYKVTLGSDFEHWKRFDLFLTVVGYTADSKVANYQSSTARQGDGNITVATRQESGTVSVSTQPCDHIEIFAYVIANAFPETDSIREAPPFEARLVVHRDNDLIESSRHDVNQWGGMTISGYRLPKE